jgi:hypothetical protein
VSEKRFAICVLRHIFGYFYYRNSDVHRRRSKAVHVPCTTALKSSGLLYVLPTLGARWHIGQRSHREFAFCFLVFLLYLAYAMCTFTHLDVHYTNYVSFNPRLVYPIAPLISLSRNTRLLGRWPLAGRLSTLTCLHSWHPPRWILLR